MNATTQSEGDLLSGYEEIGAFLRMSAQQAKHLARSGGLPTFRLGGRIVRARRSSLNAWLAEREAEARKAPGP